MNQSNVALSPDQVNFCRYALRPLCFRGYFQVDWAGAAGSGREFYRLTIDKDTSMVLMLWNGTDPDWDYFLAMQQLRAQQELSMLPAIISFNREDGLVLIEDGGSRRLRDILFTGISEQKKVKVLNSVIDQLISWQGTNIEDDSLIASRALDEEQFLWETSYFHKHICALMPELKELFDETWESERISLAKQCDSLDKTLLHRDFQSENITIKNQKVSFVDFQGARLGAPEYDLASLLYDPYLYPLLTDSVRKQVLDHYIESRSTTSTNLNLCATQRLMQALGAYGNLSLNRGKKQYIKFVYPALINLVEVTSISNYPQIMKIAQTALEMWKNR